MTQTNPPPGAGLPMTSKWDPERLQQEIADLQALESQPLGKRAGGYIKRTGPGLLQSAMTLGAGSAVASVVAGASFGYQLLWVQPVAMFLGICMLAALGNIVMTKGERPYLTFGRELHPVLPFLWGLATLVATVIWHFPQYGLAAGAARDLAELFGAEVYVASETGATVITGTGYLVSFGVGFAILAVSIFTTWSYGGKAKGIRLYEWFLRGVICVVILSFATVVIATGIDWKALFKGLFGFHLPRTPEGIQTVLGAIGASVGINMTFLYGYSLLAKGWGQHHKKLARWDLGMSMFVPFVLVTSLVIIAMANTIYDPALGDAVRKDMRPVDAAQALVPVMGASLGRIVFNLGFIAMTCGAISAHMVVCGFTVCEMFKLEYTVKRYRMFTLLPVIGVLGVVTTTPLWLPIAASAIAFTMLPIAYLTFLVMNNRRSYLGEAVGHGWKRVVFNLILSIALLTSIIGAAIQIKTRVIDQLPKLLGSPAAKLAPQVPPSTTVIQVSAPRGWLPSGARAATDELACASKLKFSRLTALDTSVGLAG
jgi:manganese transport protein